MPEVHVDHQVLEQFMFKAFQKLGVPEEDALIVARVLIAADLRGIESHGIGRMMYYYQRIKRGQHNVITNLTILKDSMATAVIDGGHGMGHVIAHRAMQMAIDRAKEFGIGAVAVRNSTHFGIAGFYPLMAVQEGCVGICTTNARPAISPTFGVEPMMGTNPFAIGMPTDEATPFLFDAATSIVQRGKIEVLDRTGTSVPEGWVINKEGGSSCDPGQILKDFVAGNAALLPLGGQGELLGGHKGYGFAATAELLCAAFQDGAFLKGLSGLTDEGEHTRFKVGHFFIAIDPDHFMGLDVLQRIAGSILRSLRESEKAPGVDRILTAGEKEFLAEKRVREQGVPLNEALQEHIREIMKELGMQEPEFSFL